MIGNLGFQASAGFDPRSVPGLVGWWDAAAVNGKGVLNPSSGNVVNSWKDISGNGYDLTPPDSYIGPRFEQDALHFYSSNTVRLFSDSIPELGEATLFHAYQVATNTVNSYSTLVQLGSSNQRMSHQPAPTGRHDRARWDKLTNTNVTLTGINNDTTSRHIFTLAGQMNVAGGGAYKCRTDGTEIGTSIFSDPSASSLMSVITRIANAENDNYTSAILLYAGYLSNATCLQIERWLGQRFNIAVA